MVFRSGPKIAGTKASYILRHYYHHDMHSYDSSSNGVAVFLGFKGNDTIRSLGVCDLGRQRVSHTHIGI